MSKQEAKILKRFKVRKAGESRKFGVAAATLKELIRKGCDIFQSVSVSEARCCLYEDGTILTEGYFLHVPDNTEVVLLSTAQNWNGSVVYDISQVLSLDRHADSELINAAKNLLHGDDGDKLSAKMRKILGDLILKDNAHLENREQDKDWFEGINTRFKTKSAYMKFNCEQRIRGYLKEMDGEAQTIKDTKVKREYENLVERLKEMLKSAHYNGSYFDRTEKKLYRFCSDEGWFSCQGAFDKEKCESLHSVNPYGNRETRILFSTWNLDHRIEKKRTIIPKLIEALQGKKSSDINLDYFYKLLFTQENLKLVDIVCHKKGAHHLQCDSRKVYKRVKKIQK